MNNKSPKDQNYKDFRCPQCNALQFKYKLDREAFKLSVKCYGCNHFSTLELNLEPLIDVLSELKRREKNENPSKVIKKTKKVLK